MFLLTPLPNWKPPEPKVIEPVPYDMKASSKRIAVFDTETDPFEYGVAVKPFTCGFYDGDVYLDFWGADCVDQFFTYLNSREDDLCIYVHNGGNFDFYFCAEYIDRGSSPFIINGRLARLYMQGQEFRDSYSLIPVALASATKGVKNAKLEIDYDKFKPGVREAHKAEILEYQQADCVSLYDLVYEARVMFGDRLTMASVALPTLRSFHGFENMPEKTDAEMRPFYFGGRNQCFEVGELHDDWKIYDVNSMYPHVMASEYHPISATPKYEKSITERTHFAKIRAWSNGALPVRAPNGGLSFPVGNGDFFATIHEIRAGLETGTLRISKVDYSIYFEEQSKFSEFVDHFYTMRLKAKANGDELRVLFYKLVLNSSYGKLAQDPRRYENFLFNPDRIPMPLRCTECSEETKYNDRCENCVQGDTSWSGWYPHTIRENEIIYARPSSRLARHGFYNVATAASITGAARANLLRGIQRAERPVYCDTDSIICRSLNADHDTKRLGAWKLEASGDVACIAGKKLYAVFNRGEAIKSASKGVKLTAQEITRVCRGETVEYSHPVPKFQLNGGVEFTKRNIKQTAWV